MTAMPDDDVSRETSNRLAIHERLLRKWAPTINLVSQTTLPDLWNRHFRDSLQLHALAPHPVGHWADLGSGAGFPGMVMAILGLERGSPRRTTLIESDARKCAFLATVARETGAEVEIINERLENVAPLGADVISARALGNLSKLLPMAQRHMAGNGRALFPKGRNWRKELGVARSAWKFHCHVDKSITEEGSVILTIEGITRV